MVWLKGTSKVLYLKILFIGQAASFKDEKIFDSFGEVQRKQVPSTSS